MDNVTEQKLAQNLVEVIQKVIDRDKITTKLVNNSVIFTQNGQDVSIPLFAGSKKLEQNAWNR